MMSKPTPDATNEFERAAAESQGESLLSEFWAFLRRTRSGGCCRS